MTTHDHPYICDVQRYGRTERVFQTRRFALDLAPLVGAAAVDTDTPSDAPRLVRNDGLTIYVRNAWRRAQLGRAEVGVGAPEIERQVDGPHYVAKFPSITLDASRPLDKLAADIRRRLIEPAAEPLAKLRKHLAETTAGRAECERHAAAIRQRWPAARIEFGDARKTTATLYLAGLSARLASDGGLYVDRLGRVDSARTMALLAALADPIADEG